MLPAQSVLLATLSEALEAAKKVLQPLAELLPAQAAQQQQQQPLSAPAPAAQTVAELQHVPWRWTRLTTPTHIIPTQKTKTSVQPLAQDQTAAQMIHIAEGVDRKKRCRSDGSDSEDGKEGENDV